MDPIVSRLVQAIHEEIHEAHLALAKTPFDSLYSVGKVQGKIEGLAAALEILKAAIEDQQN